MRRALFPLLTIFATLFEMSFLSAASPPRTHFHLEEPMGLPWFTGPLLTPSGHIVPFGHYNIEPYLFFTNEHGAYNSTGKYTSQVDKTTWNCVLPIQLGAAPNLEVDIIPQIFSHRQSGQSFTGIGDTILHFATQVSNNHTSFVPTCNVYITESLPTGNYKNFSYGKQNIQETGSGAFETTFGAVFTRTYHLGYEHYLAWRTNVAYTVSSKAHVKGFNAYGGGFGTDGYAYPGNEFIWQLGLEYSLNSHWALAGDIQYANQSKTKFKGIGGKLPNGQEATNTAPSSYQWSLAPAIECNFNSHIGLIAGVWFTFYGKNTDAFTSGVLAVNIYY